MNRIPKPSDDDDFAVSRLSRETARENYKLSLDDAVGVMRGVAKELGRRSMTEKWIDHTVGLGELARLVEKDIGKARMAIKGFSDANIRTMIAFAQLGMMAAGCHFEESMDAESN